MKKLNNLTVYLSKSLQTPESKLRPIREHLIGLGLNVTEYKEGTTYTDKKLREADFVLFVTLNNPGVWNIGQNVYSSMTSKGQFSESETVYKLRKPAFVYHLIDNDNILRVSKFANDDWVRLNSAIYDRTDWKKNYGRLYSYYKGVKLTNLEQFVEGMFYERIHKSDIPNHIKHYPLTPDQAFSHNYQLLLLLS